MPNISYKTKPVAFRLSVEDYEVIERRIKKHPWVKTAGQYCRVRLEYDIRRKHRRAKR